MYVVVAAIVAGAVSIIVTFGKAAWDSRQRKQERGIAARVELDRYREPLLTAIDDLGNRIENIRKQEFLEYLRTDRHDLALRSTLFRIAKYFGWVEILYGASGQYRFTVDKNTKQVASKLAWVGATFASDEYHDRLMLWREEQRAIGELMLTKGVTPGCIGFSTFGRQYQERFAERFKDFSDELEVLSRGRAGDVPQRKTPAAPRDPGRSAHRP